MKLGQKLIWEVAK